MATFQHAARTKASTIMRSSKSGLHRLATDDVDFSVAFEALLGTMSDAARRELLLRTMSLFSGYDPTYPDGSLRPSDSLLPVTRSFIDCCYRLAECRESATSCATAEAAALAAAAATARGAQVWRRRPPPPSQTWRQSPRRRSAPSRTWTAARTPASPM